MALLPLRMNSEFLLALVAVVVFPRRMRAEVVVEVVAPAVAVVTWSTPVGTGRKEGE